MSEKLSPKKLSREIDSAAGKSLTRLQAPANLPSAKLPQDRNLSGSTDEHAGRMARILKIRDKINAKVAQVRTNPQTDADYKLLERLEKERAKEGTRRYEARSGRKAVPGVADDVPLFSQGLKTPARVYNDVFATEETKRKNREVARMVEGKVKRARDARLGVKVVPGVADDKVLFDLDEQPEDVKTYNDAFDSIDAELARDAKTRKNREVAKKVLEKVRKDQVARQMVTKPYEQYGVPLETMKDSAKTQEVPMMFDEEDGTGEFAEDNFFEKKTEKALPAYRETKTERELPAYQEGISRVEQAARDVVVGLGFSADEAELMIDRDFCVDLKKKQFVGNESGVIASIAKEKVVDLKAYFKQFGATIDKYGDPDFGLWAKMTGLFGGYNKRVMELKNDPEFQRLKLLEMLALDAGDQVMEPRKTSSSFGKKAVMGAAAAAAIYGAATGGNKKVENYSPSKPTADKVERMSTEPRRAESPRIELPSEEYIFSEEEASLEDGEDDEDFSVIDRKVDRIEVAEPAPRKNTLKEALRVYKKAEYDDKSMRKEGNMRALEKFFDSKEFKGLPKDIRQKMIYVLAGSSIVSDSKLFQDSLDKLKRSLTKVPTPKKKMSGDDTLKFYKDLMKGVDPLINRKF